MRYLRSHQSHPTSLYTVIWNYGLFYIYIHQLSQQWGLLQEVTTMGQPVSARQSLATVSVVRGCGCVVHFWYKISVYVLDQTCNFQLIKRILYSSGSCDCIHVDLLQPVKQNIIYEIYSYVHIQSIDKYNGFRHLDFLKVAGWMFGYDRQQTFPCANLIFSLS